MKATGPSLFCAVALMALAGCGSGSRSPSSSSPSTVGHRAPAPSKPPPRRHAITLPAPGPTGIAASAGAVRLIRGWADALRSGNVRRAARYFALPSTMINGVGPGGTVSVIRIHTALQAQYANATLPCGARLLSAEQRGRYVNALFRLTGRRGPGGASCIPGVGQTARTNFVIRGGRIVEWIRAPNDPGDNGSRPGPGSRGGHPPLVPATPNV